MNDATLALMVISGIIAVGVTFGVYVKHSLDKKTKKHKIPSKKQRREALE